MSERAVKGCVTNILRQLCLRDRTPTALFASSCLTLLEQLKEKHQTVKLRTVSAIFKFLLLIDINLKNNLLAFTSGRL